MLTDHLNDADEDVLAALDDYAASLGETSGSKLRRRLASDPAFFAELAVAVGEMAKVVAAAAVLDDDASFDDCCRPLVERASDDAPPAQALRFHYLDATDELMAVLLAGRSERLRFMQRLARTRQAYRRAIEARTGMPG